MKRKHFALGMGIVAMAAASWTPVARSADIEEQSKNVFNAMSNVTDPSVSMNARMGVVTGGGISIRNKLTSQQPLNVQLPRVSAGCGGIDLFMGSFSFISSDQLVAALRAIPSAAVSYGFHLALKAMCPSCEEDLSKLQSEVNAWTQQGLGTCQLTQSLFHATKADNAIDSTFSQYRFSLGWAADALDSHNQGKNETPEKDAADKDPEDHKKIIPGNIIWKAMSQANSGSWLMNVTDTAGFKEVIMSMTGTYIWCTEGVGGCPANPDAVGQTGDTLPIEQVPTLSVKDFIYGTGDHALHNVTVLKCGEPEQCLNVTTSAVSNMKGLRQMVLDVLVGTDGNSGLIDAIASGSRTTTTQEDALAENGGLYVQLAMQQALKSPSFAKSLVIEYSDVIAADLAEKIIGEDLSLAMESLSSVVGNRTKEGRKLIQDAFNRMHDEVREIQNNSRNRADFTTYVRNIDSLRPQQVFPGAPIGSAN